MQTYIGTEHLASAEFIMLLKITNNNEIIITPAIPHAATPSINQNVALETPPSPATVAHIDSL